MAVDIPARKHAHAPRDPERIERMLDLLRDIWTEQPDTRLLQLLVNTAPQGDAPVPHLYHLEDERLEGLLRERYGKSLETGTPAP